MEASLFREGVGWGRKEVLLFGVVSDVLMRGGAASCHRCGTSTNIVSTWRLCVCLCPRTGCDDSGFVANIIGVLRAGCRVRVLSQSVPTWALEYL